VYNNEAKASRTGEPLATSDEDPAAGATRRRRGRRQAFPQAPVCVAGESGEVLNPKRATGWTEVHLRQRPLTAQQRRAQENRVYPWTSGL
jgi:hypothetical protein